MTGAPPCSREKPHAMRRIKGIYFPAQDKALESGASRDYSPSFRRQIQGDFAIFLYCSRRPSPLRLSRAQRRFIRAPAKYRATAYRAGPPMGPSRGHADDDDRAGHGGNSAADERQQRHDDAPRRLAPSTPGRRHACGARRARTARCRLSATNDASAKASISMMMSC